MVPETGVRQWSLHSHNTPTHTPSESLLKSCTAGTSCPTASAGPPMQGQLSDNEGTELDIERVPNSRALQGVGLTLGGQQCHYDTGGKIT